MSGGSHLGGLSRTYETVYVHGRYGIRPSHATNRKCGNEVEVFNHCDEIRPRIERVSYVRTVQFERTYVNEAAGECRNHVAAGLSINVSSLGLCLLVDWVPVMGEIWRVHMPMPVSTAQTPTLADVRWARPIVFHGKELAIVGLKFLL